MMTRVWDPTKGLPMTIPTGDIVPETTDVIQPPVITTALRRQRGVFKGDLFSIFNRQATSGPIRADLLPPMRRHAPDNDDVRIPHFASARRAYLGAQRKGVVDDHPEARTITGSVGGA